MSEHQINSPTGSRTSQAAASEAAVQAARNAAERLASVGAETASANAQTINETVRSGLDIAADAARSSAGGVTESMSGEKAREAMQNSAHHVEAISGAGSVLSQSFQDISREWMTWAKGHAEKTQLGFSELMQCRSPHDLFEVQSRLVKEDLEHFVTSTQRVSEISNAAAKQATQKISATRAF